MMAEAALSSPVSSLPAASSLSSEAEVRQRLLRNAKKEVKQIMEEAVTRKFVHEDSSHIISFCAAVEACILHGLKRRAAGFLRSNKMAALFLKAGKSFPPAEELCRKVQGFEQAIENMRNQGSGMQENVRNKMAKFPNLSPQAIRHLWIRTALFEKVLDKIVHHLVENSSKYYEKEALLMDPVDGPILASLLVGPCALEYTRMKTSDHFWTDPSADELVQRHRIHGSSHGRQDSPTKRPALCIQKRHSSTGSMDDRPSLSARDYVASLHQNNRATLLYGKNNVLVQPRDDMEAIPGYLSLHQTADVMTLKWTPNQLMNGSVGDLDYEKSVYWDYAMTIHLEEIVYLHCHQQVDSGGTVVLVSQDGIQRPPLRFPKGGHLLQFLSCLENGLLPHGQLDPPLWSQRGKGKVFPKLKKRNSPGSSESDKEDEEATDYVFRILYPGMQSDFVSQDIMDAASGAIPPIWQPSTRKSSCSSCSHSGSTDSGPPNMCNHERTPLKLLCDNMKYQILSRAFYGWLAYCRHLSTVRTHLSALVNHDIVSPDVPCDASLGLMADVWEAFLQDNTKINESELLRLVYFGGVQHEIRKSVWPFLLGHYQFRMSEAERREVDLQTRSAYEQTMAEWLGCEAIVRQREKESHAAALAKCSTGASLDSTMERLMHGHSTLSSESSQSSSSGPQKLTRLQSDSSGSTQVFESVDEAEQTESKPDNGESKRAKTPDRMDSEDGDSSFFDTLLLVQNSYGAEMEVENRMTTVEGEGELRGPDFLDQEKPSNESWVDRNGERPNSSEEDDLSEEPEMESLYPPLDSCSLAVTDLTVREVSPVSSSGVTYSPELLDLYTVNLHRIEKDVQRCDRNYWYFTPANLEKLRNVMCSYVWHHLDIGYVQGMCDLLAPLLVILDDEALAFSCFSELMKRMNQNFPHGGAMDTHFANMRSLIQILDSELFELMHQNGDYTHFYFCYRWFLLDFKRELLYEDVFSAWEAIWAARCTSSSHFVLFMALALVELYRDIILENNMDFTDIIKFFNEMAERHDTQAMLKLARNLVYKVQTLIENK
ncbi:small G protein signaling modulator 1 [Anolis sagrei]|uniref:small G protein signaling modulator 1 n=1 Tax=Anolis sagrei TaxID=38937 RepID=UPI003520B4FF